MVQWKTMALWFSLESECFLSAIFQLLNEKWAIIIRKDCFLSRLASSLWESVYRQYFEKKNCEETQLVQISTWCKSVHWFISLQAPSFLQHRNIFFAMWNPSLCRLCPHVLWSCNCKHFCMQVTLNRKAVVNFDENLSICGSWSPF